MAHIEVGVAVVCRRIAGNLVGLVAGAASPPGGIHIVEKVRPHVVEGERQSVIHALGYGCLQRIVVGDGIVGAAADALIVRVRTEVLIAPGVGHAHRHLVKVGREGEVEAVASHIGEFRHGVGHHLTLNRQVPLINLGNRSVVLGVAGSLAIEAGWILGSRRIG